MRGGLSAALVRVVDDVVVDQGAGLVELERSGQVGHGGVREWLAGGQSPSDVRHEGPETLASRGRGQHGLGEIRRSRSRARARQEAGQGGGRRLVDVGTQHGETLAQTHRVTLTDPASAVGGEGGEDSHLPSGKLPGEALDWRWYADLRSAEFCIPINERDPSECIARFGTGLRDE